MVGRFRRGSDQNPIMYRPFKRHCGARYGCVLADTGGIGGGGGDAGENGPASSA